MDRRSSWWLIIMKNAGRETSRLFHGVQHSNDAKQLMEKFYIGDLIDPHPERYTLQVATELKYLQEVLEPTVV